MISMPSDLVNYPRGLTGIQVGIGSGGFDSTRPGVDNMEAAKELHMAYQFPPNIDRLVKEQMASGEYESEDDLLADALRALATRNADLAAVHEAIRDMEAGDVGRPLTEVADEIRAWHGWFTNG
ncbi:MAG: hypothetical protein KDB27_17440 [Planctomycetales bacterium]|nr:hypothetical protein [Planctomycetales bacterium]